MTISPCVSDRVVITANTCNGQHGVILQVSYPVYLILIEGEFLGWLYQSQFEVL